MTATKPYHECPRFEECSVNRCPLDPEGAGRVSLPDDPEVRCKARLSTRMRIAAKYDLPNRGKTDQELSRERRSDQKKAWWASLSGEEKTKRLARLKGPGTAAGLSNKRAVCSGS